MRLKLIGLALLACCCGPLSAGHAQTKSRKFTRPDLSGVWAVDQTKHQKNSFPEPSEMTLIISQQEPVITMRRKFNLNGKQQEQELVYYTDGRGETNVTLRGGDSKYESRTRWVGSSLVISHDFYSASIAGSPVDSRTEVDWRLSSDGEILTQRITTTSKPGTNVDATISAMDLRKPTIVPPTLIFERAYKKVH
jgi:hypothetical protein